MSNPTIKDFPPLTSEQKEQWEMLNRKFAPMMIALLKERAEIVSIMKREQDKIKKFYGIKT